MLSIRFFPIAPVITKISYKIIIFLTYFVRRIISNPLIESKIYYHVFPKKVQKIIQKPAQCTVHSLSKYTVLYSIVQYCTCTLHTVVQTVHMYSSVPTYILYSYTMSYVRRIVKFPLYFQMCRIPTYSMERFLYRQLLLDFPCIASSCLLAAGEQRRVSDPFTCVKLTCLFTYGSCEQ